MSNLLETFQDQANRLATVRAILEAERNVGSPSLGDLQIEIAEATAALEQISLAASKDKSRQKKEK